MKKIIRKCLECGAITAHDSKCPCCSSPLTCDPQLSDEHGYARRLWLGFWVRRLSLPVLSVIVWCVSVAVCKGIYPFNGLALVCTALAFAYSLLGGKLLALRTLIYSDWYASLDMKADRFLAPVLSIALSLIEIMTK